MSMEANARIIIDRLLHETGWDAEDILASVSSKEERIFQLVEEMKGLLEGGNGNGAV